MDRKDVRREWEDIAETYARRRDPDGSDAALVDDLLADLPHTPDVLDVGCGDTARTLATLPGGSVGLDISRRGLELARAEVPAARLLQGDLCVLPVASDRFDAVTAYHAVFHVARERHQTAYREFARVLRPGGRLLMTLSGGRFETVRRRWMGGQLFFSTPGRERTLDQLGETGFTGFETEIATDPLGSNTEFVRARVQEGGV